MYSFAVSREVLKEITNKKRFTAKIFRQIVIKILELCVEPRPPDSKPIGSGFRVDSCEYRIYYEVNGNAGLIEVLLISKRNDDEVYRKLKRKFG